MDDLASWISKCQAAQEEAARQAEAARRQAGTGRKEDNRICVGNVCFALLVYAAGNYSGRFVVYQGLEYYDYGLLQLCYFPP